MEITAQMQANQAMGFLQTQQTQLGTLESQIASGIGLQQSSDNPGAFATVMQDNAQNLNYSTYLTTISSATNTLNTSVSALNNIQSIVTQASSITQQGINGATGVSGLSALASQVNALIGSLLTTANSQVNGQYIFGGTATNTPPFAITSSDSSGNPTAITYQGSNQAGETLIGPSQTVNTQYAGNGILQQPGTDLFQTLITIRDDLSNSNLSQNQLASALTQQLSTLQQAGTNVENAIGTQSASLQNIKRADVANSVFATRYSDADKQSPEHKLYLGHRAAE